MFDIIHQLLRRQDIIGDKTPGIFSSLFDSIQSKRKMPVELIHLLNSLDFMIMEHEFESKALTYN